MKRYILEGREAEKVVKENRIRVNRGDVKFTPLAADAEIPGASSDGFGSYDTKEAPAEDTKAPAAPAKKSTRSKS